MDPIIIGAIINALAVLVAGIWGARIMRVSPIPKVKDTSINIRNQVEGVVPRKSIFYKLVWSALLFVGFVGAGVSPYFILLYSGKLDAPATLYNVFIISLNTGLSALGIAMTVLIFHLSISGSITETIYDLQNALVKMQGIIGTVIKILSKKKRRKSS